jgi:hypothetical protein
VASVISLKPIKIKKVKPKIWTLGWVSINFLIGFANANIMPMEIIIAIIINNKL